ncbi:MAG: hypothetical protein FWE23_03145 [Chitinivibrionia bacterium]|nr:hypothetical protein [Chitinivibrionia bacterium]
MRKKVVLYFFVLCLFPFTGYGQVQTFIREYTYRMSEEDSRRTARNKAHEQLRAMVLSEVGSLVQANYSSAMTVSGSNVEDLYREVITISTVGRVGLKVLDERFDEFTYWVKAELTVDVGAINEQLDKLARENREVSQRKEAQTQQNRQTEQVQAQITASERQITALANRETAARNQRNTTTARLNRSREERDRADREHNNALAFLSANPASAPARRAVEMASDSFEEAKANYDEMSLQAKIADEAWTAADSELKQERERLANLREQLRRLNSGETFEQIAARPSVPAPQQQQQASPSVADAPAQQRTAQQGGAAANEERAGMFLLSIRPEFVAGTSVMSAGATIEIGAILKNGFYLTGEIAGGAIYYGGGLNLGVCINRDGFVRNVLGVNAGYRNSVLTAEFTQNDKVYISKNGTNTSFGGAFWKLMFGNAGNFDISNKILFGQRNNPVSFRKNYNDGSDGFVYEEGLNITYSLSIGYTLTKRRQAR